MCTREFIRWDGIPLGWWGSLYHWPLLQPPGVYRTGSHFVCVQGNSSGEMVYHSGDGVASTTGHFYNHRECIGQGATSYVYKGIHQVRWYTTSTTRGSVSDREPLNMHVYKGIYQVRWYIPLLQSSGVYRTGSHFICVRGNSSGKMVYTTSTTRGSV